MAAEGYEHNTDAHWQTCDVCGFVLNKAEHSWDSGVITTPATTEKRGSKDLYLHGLQSNKDRGSAKDGETNDTDQTEYFQGKDHWAQQQDL